MIIRIWAETQLKNSILPAQAGKILSLDNDSFLWYNLCMTVSEHFELMRLKAKCNKTMDEWCRQIELQAEACVVETDKSVTAWREAVK